MSALKVPAETTAPAEMAARVLIVEDEVLVRALVAESLREAGCEVIEAASADEAVEVLAVLPALDVLITDVRLPGGVDGLELAARVRQALPGIKVIVTSGHAAAEAVRSVAHAFLPKPYDLWRLVGEVRTLAANG